MENAFLSEILESATESKQDQVEDIVGELCSIDLELATITQIQEEFSPIPFNEWHTENDTEELDFSNLKFVA